MLRIIKADLYRCIHEKVFWAIGIACIIYSAVKTIPIYSIIEKLSGLAINYDRNIISGYQAFSELGAAGFINYLIPFIIIIFFSSEFSKKTIRNIASLKIKRRTVFIGKYFSFCICTICVTTILAFSATTAFTIVNNWGKAFEIKDILNIIFLIFSMSLMQIIYASVCIILSLLIRSGAVVVIFYLGVSIIESILSSISVNLSSTVKIFSMVSYAFPSTYMDNMTALLDGKRSFFAVTTSITVYILLTVVIGSTIFEKMDIKA